MSEKLVQLTTNWEVQGQSGGGKILVGFQQDDDRMWRVQVVLNDGQTWMLNTTEAEELRKIVQIEVDKLMLAIKRLGPGLMHQARRQELQEDRKHLDNMDAMLKMASERCFQMNLIR